MAEATASSGAGALAARGLPRWPLALAVGAVATLATFTISLGDVLTAYNRPEQALALPFNRTLAAWRILAPVRGQPETPAMRKLAEESLAASPVAAVPLTWLALAEKARGRRDRADRLLALAATAGWHDEVAQRQLYNLAVSRGDFPTALRHADALLRQGYGREELFGRFDLGMERPAFRKAMAAVAETSPGWPRDYIAGHGARLSDEALASLLDARRMADGSLAREIAVPLISGLLTAGRDAAAVRVWRRVSGADGLAPGLLTWRDGAMVAPAGAFDWQLPEGFRIEGLDEATLLAGFDAAPQPVRRMVALPSGRWRLSPARADAVSGTWQWSLACRNRAEGPWLPLVAGQAAAVPAGCPVQVLALRRANPAEDGVLPQLRLERLP